ncbi:MAG: PKD domain-containing protein [Bacteroidota bacterium]|nr:PKD domain-containing protein [Bacteroidota bacterium]
MRKLVLILFLFLVALSNNVKAQGTAGKDFWVAFMAQDWGCYYNYYYYNNDTAELFLSSQFAAVVYIEAKGQNFYDTITLSPNETSMVRLPREVVCRYSDTVTLNGVHVYSDTTINVYAVNRYWYSKGATVVIPSSSIIQSPEYIITTNRDAYSWGWSCNGKNIQSPEFTIVGIADSSVIEIVPTGASSRNSLANVPFQITLKKGQTFQYMTTDRDLTGSFVRSKYIESKFAVFAGNRQTYTNRTNQNGTSCNSSWDHTYEQLIPTVTWGKNYTSLPYRNNTKGYTLKIVAAENNTIININGNYHSTLNQSGFLTYEVYNESVVRISGSNRISVAQFALGGYSCQNHPTKLYIGDPSQLQLFPDEQFGNNATINTVSQVPWWWNSNWYNWWWQQNSPEHYVNVLTKTIDTSYFTFDNKRIKASDWKSSNNLPDHHYAQIQMDTGSHHMNSPKGFLSYVYGYGYFDGYAYAAAAKFDPIQNNFIIINAQCVRDTVSFQAILNDSFNNHKWTIQSRQGLVYGTKIKHKFADTGWYEVKMYCQHKRTNLWDSVTKVLYVADTKIKSLLKTKDTLICGKVDMIEISKGFNVDNEYRWQDNWPVYYRAMKSPATYWLEVTERNGCTFRDTMVVRSGIKPQSNFTVSDTQFCFNSNKKVSFNNLSSSVEDVDFYRWSYDGLVDSIFKKDSVIQHQFKTANLHPIILRTYTKKGCYHDTFMMLDVLHSPKAEFTYTRKDTCISTNRVELKNQTVINTNYHQRYRWRFSDGNNISNNNPAPRVYADTGIFSVQLIYDNNNGCSDTMRKYIHIKPLPKPDFNFINGTYCEFDSIQFNNVTNTPYAPSSSKWRFGDGTTSLLESPRKAFVDKGNLEIKLISTSSVGCTDSISKSIFINGTPRVSFEINQDTQCFNQHNFNFTNQTNFNSALIYEWNLGDATFSNDSNVINKKYLKDSFYQVQLKATTGVGCNASSSQMVYIGGYPIANYLIDMPKQCLRDNVFNFTQNSNIQKGSIVAFQWQLGEGGDVFGPNVINKKYNIDDTFNVSLIVQSDLGCLDTIIKSIVVFPQPNASFNVNQLNQCFNEHLFQLTNSSIVRNENLLFNWTFGDNSSATNKDITKKYAQPGLYDIRLEAISDNGCKDTSSIKSVVVYHNPAAQFSVNKTEQCFKNHNFNFTNQSTISDGFLQGYRWIMGDVSQFTTPNVTNHIYANEDTFNVKLIATSNNNCTDTVLKMVVTYAQPKLQFGIQKDTQCWQNNVFVIENKTNIKYGELFNTWDFGDNSFSNNYQPNEKVYPNASGAYLVKYKVVSDNGCSDSMQRVVHLLERPMARFEVNDSIQCFNKHLFSFINQTSFSVMNSLSYSWDYKNGNTSFNITPINATYTESNIFNVKLLVSSTLNNCFDTFVKPIIVAPMPELAFSINKDSQCLNNNYFEYTNQSVIKFGSMSFEWQDKDGIVNQGLNADKSYANETYQTMQLIATSNYGCKDSLSQNIGFYPTPVPNFTINDPIQCLNQHSFDFINISNKVNSLTTYKWLISDGFISNDKNLLNKTFLVHDTQIIQLNVISSKGCSDSLKKIVYIEKDMNYSLNPLNDVGQCFRGNSFDLIASNSNSKVKQVSNQWLMGDGNSFNNSMTVNHQYTKEEVYTVIFESISENGCKDITNIELEVFHHPETDFEVAPVCFPEQSNFVNLSSIKKGAITSQEWFFGDGRGSLGINPQNRYKEFGLYDIRLINKSDKNCLDTLIKNQIAAVYEKPAASFDFTRLKSINNDESRLQFQNNSSPIAIQFNWKLNQNDVSSLREPLILLEDTGRFNITLVSTSSEGCSDTSSRIIGPIFPDFNFYLPNAFSPNTDIHNPVYKGVGSKYTFKYKMEIFNRWGEKVFETTDVNQGWDGTYKGVPCMEGNYICRVQVAPFNEPFRSYEQVVQLLR